MSTGDCPRRRGSGTLPRYSGRPRRSASSKAHAGSAAGTADMASWQGNEAPGAERDLWSDTRSCRDLVLTSRAARHLGHIVTSRAVLGGGPVSGSCLASRAGSRWWPGQCLSGARGPAAGGRSPAAGRRGRRPRWPAGRIAKTLLGVPSATLRGDLSSPGSTGGASTGELGGRGGSQAVRSVQTRSDIRTAALRAEGPQLFADDQQPVAGHPAERP